MSGRGGGGGGEAVGTGDSVIDTIREAVRHDFIPRVPEIVDFIAERHNLTEARATDYLHTRLTRLLSAISTPLLAEQRERQLRIDTLEEHVNTLRTAYAKSVTKVGALEKARSAADRSKVDNGRLKALKNTESELKRNLAALLSAFGKSPDVTVGSTPIAMTAAWASLKEKVHDLVAQKERARAEREGLQRQVDQFKDATHEWRNKNDKLRREFDERKAVADREKEELERALADKNDTVRRLEVEGAECRDRLDATRSKAKEAVAARQAKIDELFERIRSVESDLEDEERRCENVEEQYRERQNRMADEIEELRLSTDRMSASVAAARSYFSGGDGFENELVLDVLDRVANRDTDFATLPWTTTTGAAVRPPTNADAAVQTDPDGPDDVTNADAAVQTDPDGLDDETVTLFESMISGALREDERAAAAAVHRRSGDAGAPPSTEASVRTNPYAVAFQDLTPFDEPVGKEEEEVAAAADTRAVADDVSEETVRLLESILKDASTEKDKEKRTCDSMIRHSTRAVSAEEERTPVTDADRDLLAASIDSVDTVYDAASTTRESPVVVVFGTSEETALLESSISAALERDSRRATTSRDERTPVSERRTRNPTVADRKRAASGRNTLPTNNNRGPAAAATKRADATGEFKRPRPSSNSGRRTAATTVGRGRKRKRTSSPPPPTTATPPSLTGDRTGRSKIARLSTELERTLDRLIGGGEGDTAVVNALDAAESDFASVMSGEHRPPSPPPLPPDSLWPQLDDDDGSVNGAATIGPTTHGNELRYILDGPTTVDGTDRSRVDDDDDDEGEAPSTSVIEITDSSSTEDDDDSFRSIIQIDDSSSQFSD